MARHIKDTDVLIYAARNPKEILSELEGDSVGVMYAGGKRVLVQSKYDRRVIYYPISNGNGSHQLLIGVVGSPVFVRNEKTALNSRYGEGSVVDVTSKIRQMRDTFILLNRTAREQRL